jgi:uncharacterized protein
MKNRPQNPRRLDVAAFAALGDGMDGVASGADLPRLAQTCVSGVAFAPVPWTLRGEVVRKTGYPDASWLYLEARAEVWLECQRCLEPLSVPIELARSARFVPDEDTAAALDLESDDDVLALSKAFDVLEWLEDEVLLALPLVPRHKDCRAPGGVAVTAADGAPEGDDELPAERANPFSALAALKGKEGSKS